LKSTCKQEAGSYSCKCQAAGQSPAGLSPLNLSKDKPGKPGNWSFFSIGSYNFPQCGYEISMGEKIVLTLHDLPEILLISTVFFEAPRWSIGVGKISDFY